MLSRVICECSNEYYIVKVSSNDKRYHATELAVYELHLGFELEVLLPWWQKVVVRGANRACLRLD